MAGREFNPSDYMTGKVKLPPWIKNKKQHHYVYTASQSMASTASPNFQIIPITIQKDAHFLVEAISIRETAATSISGLPSTCQFVDLGRNQAWSSGFTRIADATGGGSNMKLLTCPNLLLPASTFNVNYRSTATSICYVSLIGRKIFGLTKEEVEFLSKRLAYQYVLTVPAISANTFGTTSSVQIYSESDFLLRSLVSVGAWEATAVNSTSDTAETVMQLRDTSKDRSFFSKKVSTTAFLGGKTTQAIMGLGVASSSSGIYTWGEPFHFPKPIKLNRNATVQGTFDNASSRSLATFNILLEGIRMF